MVPVFWGKLTCFVLVALSAHPADGVPPSRFGELESVHVAAVDSVHWRVQLPPAEGSVPEQLEEKLLIDGGVSVTVALRSSFFPDRSAMGAAVAPSLSDGL